MDPKYDKTFYIGSSKRRVHIRAVEGGEGFVFSVTSTNPAEFVEGDMYVPNEQKFDARLAELGLRKLTAEDNAANIIFSLVAPLFDVIKRHVPETADSSLKFHHQTPDYIRERFKHTATD